MRSAIFCCEVAEPGTVMRYCVFTEECQWRGQMGLGGGVGGRQDGGQEVS